MRAHTKTSSLAASLLLAFVGPATAATPGLTLGTFAAGEKVTPPETLSPKQVSRAAVQTVTADGGSARVELTATGGGSLLVWTLPHGLSDGAEVSSSLKTPKGRALAAGQKASRDSDLRRFAFEGGEVGLETSAVQEVVHVAAAEAGVHTLELTSDAKAYTVVAAEPESDLTLSTWAGPLSRQPGEPVTLYAQLSDGDAAVRSGHVSARLLAPQGGPGEPVELFDDGRHGDGAAGDGLFAATLAALPGEASGFWNVRFEAQGRDRAGHAFARTGATGFVAERGAARLVDASLKAEVVGEALHVSTAALVNVAGDYRFDVIVSGAAQEGLAWAELTQSLGKGRAPLAVDIPLSSLGAAKGLHVDVRLLGLDPIGVAGRAEIDF